MRNLIDQPLKLEEAERINKAAFYFLFNENLEKILNASEAPSETEVEAAKDNISLCRAAIGGFAAKGDLKAVHEIIDYYGPWSRLIARTAQAAIPGKQKGMKGAQSYNIIYLPEENEKDVINMLKKITASVCLAENAKAGWQKFKDNGGWENGIIVGDGGMGTALIECKLKPTPVAWLNKERGDEVLKIHKRHIGSGAQIVLSNTLDANKKVLDMYRDKKYVQVVKELNKIGVAIAHNACEGEGGDILVFGSMGPSRCDQKLFLSMSNGGREAIEKELREAFKEQAVELQSEGVDGIWIEGMTYIEEAVIAVEAVKKHTDVPVICTMQFEIARGLGKIDFKTVNWRDGISKVVSKLKEAGADMIGASCGNVVESMPLLAQKMREQSVLPLVFKMNAGYDRKTMKYKTGDRREPDEFAEVMSQVAAAGGNIVAGCCWTTHEHVAAVRRYIS